MLGWAVQYGKQDPLKVTPGVTCPLCSSVRAAWRVPVASFLVDCRGAAGEWLGRAVPITTLSLNVQVIPGNTHGVTIFFMANGLRRL